MAAALVALTVMTMGCGGADETAAVPEPPSTTGVSPSPTDPPAPTRAASSSAVATSAPTSVPAGDCIGQLALRHRLAQLLMPLVVQDDLDVVAEAVASGEVTGFALLGRPDGRLADQIAALEDLSPLPLLIASDEEGGTVQRLSGLLGELPAAADVVGRPVAEVAGEAQAYSRAMEMLGVGVRFAPVIDVGGGPGIGTRSFSADPNVVAQYGLATAEGTAAAGVLPVLKHFPGHGRADADSHESLPLTPPIAELREVDLVPYVEILASGTPVAVMVAHLLVPGLAEDLPTSLSPDTVDGLLRGELGFDGLVFTDALNMGAVAARFSVPEAMVLALLAGADVGIVSSVNDIGPTLDSMERAVANGELTEARINESVARVLVVKDADPCTAG